MVARTGLNSLGLSRSHVALAPCIETTAVFGAVDCPVSEFAKRDPQLLLRARVVLPGYPHHVIQRGHNRAAVFVHAKDYGFYLNTLE